MLTAKFPVYAMRPYIRRLVEPPYIIIETRFNRYVLDMPSLPGSYSDRRVAMLGLDPGYPMYPLKERFSTIAQILCSKRRDFIDADGKMWKLKKEQYYKLKSYAVLQSSTTWSGSKLLHTKGGSFIASEVWKYVTVVETVKGSVLFDLSNEPTSRTRIKL